MSLPKQNGEAMKTTQMRTVRRVGTFLFLGSVLVGCVATAGAATQKAASTSEPAPIVTSTGGLLSPGFLSTSGNQIVDSTGRPQRMACVGYNEPGKDIVGDVAGMKKAGFNCLRYPFDERGAALHFRGDGCDCCRSETAGHEGYLRSSRG